MTISIQGSQFIDEHGRTLHLRGVNLGGSSKVPAIPNGATWIPGGFFDHRQVSFVGRPFPLEEADEHFSRLKKWGLNFLRFLITWEAIEHEGPGKYDQEYLDYLYQVIKKAGEYDLCLFIDPHQDTWSRFSGGDGAPGWTFDAVGMDMKKFKVTGAAITHQQYGAPFPHLHWTSNYSKFACATMNTLFFGGDVFAPNTFVEGIPVQEFLQSHYIHAIQQVCQRLKEFPFVIGYDTGNEPSQGYIGYPDLDCIPAKVVARGPSPSIYQGILLAAGYPQQVKQRSLWSNLLDWNTSVLLNPGNMSLWQAGVKPIWQHNGVWDVDRQGKPHLLNPKYFSKVNGRAVDFDLDFFTPFVMRYTKAIRGVDPRAFIFISPPPPDIRYGSEHIKLSDQEHMVHSPHWYDGIALQSRAYISWFGIDSRGGRRKFIFGRQAKRKSFQNQIKRFIECSETMLGGVPTVIAETGIPFDMSKKSSFRDGDFSQQIRALDDTMQALEANRVNFTLWNYTADNSNQRGDQWNNEDFSIFSRDQQKDIEDINSGGRALQAILRPYVIKTPGKLLSINFNIKSRVFSCSFEWDSDIRAPLELFIPEFQYPHGFEVFASNGEWDFNPDTQILTFPVRNNEIFQQIKIIPKMSE